MYFITEPGTELYAKFQEFEKEVYRCHNAARGLAEKYGAKRWIAAPFCIGGGVEALEFEGDPPEGWVKYNSRKYSNMYRPAKNKASKDVRDELENLPRVSNDAYNKLIGFKEIDKGVKTLFSPSGTIWKGFYGVVFPDYITPDDYKPVPGMKEVTHSEYHRLLKEVEDTK